MLLAGDAAQVVDFPGTNGMAKQATAKGVRGVREGRTYLRA
jgi:hypothetical protein